MMFNVLKDIYFWSGIMRDHAEFQILSFSPNEMKLIERSRKFKEIFVDIHKETKCELDNFQGYDDFVCRTSTVLKDFIQYKKLLISKLMKCEIELNLSPSFINHMVNEANEFYRLLWLSENNIKYNPIREIIYEHNIWLLDAGGHAVAIAGGVDAVERGIINKAEKFRRDFRDLFMKNYELGVILERTGLCNGSLEKFNDEAEEKIKEFICFLRSIEKLRRECKIMGTMKPILPDHMIREEEYYLYKIRSFTEKING